MKQKIGKGTRCNRALAGDGAGTALKMDHTRLGKTLQLPPPFHYNGQRLTCELTVYPDMYAAFWYHPDHLGSSSYITNLAGEITQHMEYLPFGETLIEEHLNSNNSPYKFNAKEYDAETGNYYYGARYYDPKFSIWLSVDPLAEMFPGWSPYNYTMNNPINLIDPTGMGPEDWVQRGDGSIYWDKNANSQETTKAGETYLGKTLTFEFNSYIDGANWDGPNPLIGPSPVGDKLTSTINVTGVENAAGELTGINATMPHKPVVGDTPLPHDCIVWQTSIQSTIHEYWLN